MPACVADYCLDWNNDCCAPTQFDEPVACADGYTPQLTGEGCYDFEDGAFECCEPLPATSDEAAELLARLAKGAGETVLWGHQDDLASGATWSAVNGGDGAFRSDVLDLCGVAPTVFGWDVGGFDRAGAGKFASHNLDGVSFAAIERWVRWGAEARRLSAHSAMAAAARLTQAEPAGLQKPVH